MRELFFMWALIVSAAFIYAAYGNKQSKEKSDRVMCEFCDHPRAAHLIHIGECQWCSGKQSGHRFVPRIE